MNKYWGKNANYYAQKKILHNDRFDSWKLLSNRMKSNEFFLSFFIIFINFIQNDKCHYCSSNIEKILPRNLKKSKKKFFIFKACCHSPMTTKMMLHFLFFFSFILECIPRSKNKWWWWYLIFYVKREKKNKNK